MLHLLDPEADALELDRRAVEVADAERDRPVGRGVNLGGLEAVILHRKLDRDRLLGLRSAAEQRCRSRDPCRRSDPRQEMHRDPPLTGRRVGRIDQIPPRA